MIYELAFRVRRWLYGSPFGYTPLDREVLKEWHALHDEHPREVEDFTLPSGRVIHRVKTADGLADELSFRRYARASGQVLR